MIGCVLLALAFRAGVHSTTPRVTSGLSPYNSIESYSAFPAKRLVFRSRGGDGTAHAIPAPSTLFVDSCEWHTALVAFAAAARVFGFPGAPAAGRSASDRWAASLMGGL